MNVFLQFIHKNVQLSVNPGAEGEAQETSEYVLPRDGSEQLIVKVHSAMNLADDKNEGQPTPYVVVSVLTTSVIFLFLNRHEFYVGFQTNCF